MSFGDYPSDGLEIPWEKLSVKEFEVYRPEQISSRLEPIYAQSKPDVCRPSISYHHTLQDIKNQFTPAEYYRHNLQTSGPYIRMIQRLESRWHKNYLLWNQSTILIQRIYRGVLGRRIFVIVKEKNYDRMLRRKYYPIALAAYTAESYQECLQIICTQAPQPLEGNMQVLVVKSYYRLQDYQQCVQQAKVLRGKCIVSLCTMYYLLCTIYVLYTELIL